MASKGMHTNLIGRKVAPKKGLLQLWPVTKEGSTIQRHDLEPQHLEYCEATIMAAWVESRSGPSDTSMIRIATESATGDTREFFLTHVRLLPKDKLTEEH